MMSFSSFSGPTSAPPAMHNVMATNNPIRYHSTEAKRLLEVTVEGLSSNGIEIDGLGEKKNGKYILRGGLTLTAHAAEQLPPEMGGRSRKPAVGMDPRTVSFMQSVNIHSPAGYKSASKREGVDRYGSTRGSGHGPAASQGRGDHPDGDVIMPTAAAFGGGAGLGIARSTSSDLPRDVREQRAHTTRMGAESKHASDTSSENVYGEASRDGKGTSVPQPSASETAASASGQPDGAELEVTIEGLSSNGIEIDGLGEKKNGEYILRGGLTLTAHAAEQLPPEMGGRSRKPAVGMDPRTVSFMQQVNIHSHAGYKGASARESVECCGGRRGAGLDPWPSRAGAIITMGRW